MEIDPKLLTTFRPPAFPNSYMFSFEGIEGCGKSTQITLVKDFLEKIGHRVKIVREPGGTDFGEKLREAILKSNTNICPLSEAHLFASSRAQLLSEHTLKFLETPDFLGFLEYILQKWLLLQPELLSL